MKPYILFVAGEASGDRLGESLVRKCLALGLEAHGAGGERMVGAGLNALLPFEELGVSGFLDVLPRLVRLHKHLQTLKRALLNPACKGLVCIDYPGFNLRLSRLAHSQRKWVWWIAPPQIWAWKSKRGKQFEGQRVSVLFEMERLAYATAGAIPVRVEHPLLQVSTSNGDPQKWKLALCPGSRWPQAMRNGKAYLQVARTFQALSPNGSAEFFLLAPDAALAERFRERWGNEVQVRVANASEDFWDTVTHAICPPGTMSLELALRGVALLVFSRIDILTYVLGKLFLRIPHLALPNILIGSRDVPEHVVPAFSGTPSSSMILQIATELAKTDLDRAKARPLTLRAMMTGPSPSEIWEHDYFTRNP